MKKLFASLLTLSLLLSLTACGGNGDPTGPDAPKPSQPETPELTFAVGTPLTHESTYTADDGTLLLHTNYELPQLELRTADGALYEPGAAAAQSASNGQQISLLAAQRLSCACRYPLPGG